MTELLIIFQLNTDKKTTIVSDMILPIPKWLSNIELVTLVKNTLAEIEWAGAILNIINLNTINAPKVEVVKDYTPRPERTSFWPRKNKNHSNNGFSRGEGRPSARYGGHTGRQSREEDRPPREDSRPFREERKWWFRPNKASAWWYWHKPSWWYPKWGRSSRPSRSR